MPNLDTDDLTARLRAANVAPDADDTFISQLSLAASSSRPAAVAHGHRRKGALPARFGALVLGATLVLSGGAMASALWLSSSHHEPAGPGRAPVEQTPSGDTPAPETSTSGDESGLFPTSGVPSADGEGADEKPPGNANDQSEGQGGAQQPNGNANGQSEGHGGAHQPNGNANGQSDDHGGAHQPNGNANGHGNGSSQGQGGQGQGTGQGQGGGQGPSSIQGQGTGPGQGTGLGQGTGQGQEQRQQGDPSQG